MGRISSPHFSEREVVEFSKTHLQIIDNLQLALRKCEIPGVKGEEMIALAQGYHFLSLMKQYVEVQVEAQFKAQQVQQALSTAQPIENQEPENSSRKSKK